MIPKRRCRLTLVCSSTIAPPAKPGSSQGRETAASFAATAQSDVHRYRWVNPVARKIVTPKAFGDDTDGKERACSGVSYILHPCNPRSKLSLIHLLHEMPP